MNLYGSISKSLKEADLNSTSGSAVIEILDGFHSKPIEGKKNKSKGQIKTNLNSAVIGYYVIKTPVKALIHINKEAFNLDNDINMHISIDDSSDKRTKDSIEMYKKKLSDLINGNKKPKPTIPPVIKTEQLQLDLNNKED